MSNLVAARSWPRGFSFAHNTAGAGAPVLLYKAVAAGETVDHGELVVLNNNDIEAADAADTAVLGVAAADGEAGDVIPVIAATIENVLIGQCDTSNDALEDYDFPMEAAIIETGGVFYVDLAGVGEEILHVIGPVPGDDQGDDTVVGRVYFVVKPSASQYMDYS